jgi:hypothetical protein
MVSIFKGRRASPRGAIQQDKFLTDQAELHNELLLEELGALKTELSAHENKPSAEQTTFYHVFNARLEGLRNRVTSLPAAYRYKDSLQSKVVELKLSLLNNTLGMLEVRLKNQANKYLEEFFKKNNKNTANLFLMWNWENKKFIDGLEADLNELRNEMASVKEWNRDFEKIDELCEKIFYPYKASDESTSAAFTPEGEEDVLVDLRNDSDLAHV